SGSVIRRTFVSAPVEGFLDWTHLQTFVRVESEMLDTSGQTVTLENRYFLSSLIPGRLTAEQWLAVVRAHWGVENNCHHTHDPVFREDERPWITYEPDGTLALFILRRIACTLMALFRSVTQRSEERRQTPWRDLIRAVYQALIIGPAELSAFQKRGAIAFP